MRVKLSDHFTVKKLIRFVLPSIVMMMFTSVYGVVDGFFVSNYAGKTPFAAVNLILPFIMFVSTIGFMVGQGGSAIVSKTLGEKDNEKANRIFSMLVYFVIAFGIIISVVSQIFIKRIAILLGADSSMLTYCVLYGRISLISLFAFMLQNVFQSFFVTAGKPQLGLYVTILAGVNNMVLDFLFVGVLKWGVVGAASATAISEFIGGLLPLVYFASKNKSLLRLTKPEFDIKALVKTFTNGSSELLTTASMSLVNMLYNFQLMRYIGENGVSAYGFIMYVNFGFLSVFIGYSVGVAPIVGYNFGAENERELKNIFSKSIAFISTFAFLLFGFAYIVSGKLVGIYVGYDEELLSLTLNAFRIYSLSYLIAGFNIFASSFFTALNNGAVSAAISFFRTLVFQVVAVFLLPMLFGVDGIWWSICFAEACSLLISIFFILTQNKKYHYINKNA